jgi:RHS repeat-associated protein
MLPNSNNINYSLDYHPFGMLIPNRQYSNTSLAERYRYGFNGKDLDHEGMGGGGSTYDYGFRIYNPSIAKFLSVDPLTKEFPFYTPYQFAGNKPIVAIDLDGLEELIFHNLASEGLIQAVYDNNDHLYNIIKSISDPNKSAVQKVHFVSGTFTGLTGGTHPGGITYDLFISANYIKNMADWVDNDATVEQLASLKDDFFNSYNDHKTLIEDAGLTVSKIMMDKESGVNHFVVGIDEKIDNAGSKSDDNLKTVSKVFFHEIEGHLINMLNGEDLKDEIEHDKLGNKEMIKTAEGKFIFPTRKGSKAEKTFNSIDKTVDDGCNRCIKE